jgi:hypothetical protein
MPISDEMHLLDREAGHATMETVVGLSDGARAWPWTGSNGGGTVTLCGVSELRGLTRTVRKLSVTASRVRLAG